MTLRTNLTGRLRNTVLPYSQGLLPLFEAVVNSVHAIEETKGGTAAGRIVVEILRDPQGEAFASPHEHPIIGFRIKDSGVGFNTANMQSFETLDSDYKAAKGGRGVGRLVWLKAFSNVVITSVFFDDSDKLTRRSFRFAPTGIADNTIKPEELPSPTGSEVELRGFDRRYRKASPKTALAIANALFEHILWYFIREGGAPEILLIDGNDDIDLHDVYVSHMHASAHTETRTIKERTFSLTHVKLREMSSRTHSVAFCAAGRLVSTESISGKLPGLHGKLTDEEGKFDYVCYVGSDFLDERVRPERTDFDITETPSELFKDDDIGFDDIRHMVLERVTEHLGPYLDANKARARERIEAFVSHKAPRYRPILTRQPAVCESIDPAMSDRELELKLHAAFSAAESALVAQGHELMHVKHGERLTDYRQRLARYLKEAEDIKKSDLAGYVFHRRTVLDLFTKAIERDASGSYAAESSIHELIMPMRTDTDHTPLDLCNLWLIDERLAFHNYLASDKPLSAIPIVANGSGKEPDLCALNIFDNPLLLSENDKAPQASIVVVEIKKPMRNDACEGEEKDPIEQALGYLRRIRDGKVQTRSGRPIPQCEDIPGFCYVLCDITPRMRERCEVHDAIRTRDGLGYFFYHKKFKAYVEVSSFDRIVDSATQRHRAFFDKLGLPTT
ncbi:MAG: ATP-binding protein [Planctomycetota bacterium]